MGRIRVDKSSAASIDKTPKGGRSGGKTLVVEKAGGSQSTSKGAAVPKLLEENSILLMQREI